MQIALMHAWQGKEKKKSKAVKDTEHTNHNHEWADSSVPHHLPVSPLSKVTFRL
jgi:hypothetical protein